MANTVSRFMLSGAKRFMRREARFILAQPTRPRPPAANGTRPFGIPHAHAGYVGAERRDALFMAVGGTAAKRSVTGGK